MTTRKYTSRSQQTTLTSAVTSGATIIPVSSATTLLGDIGGSSITGGITFTVVIDPDTALEEIVDVTGVSSNNLTVTRAIDGSSAQDHSSGAVIRHMIIGRDLREANVHENTSVGVHGIGATSYVVGTLDAQTLTNKTLTSPVINNPTITGQYLGDAGIVFEGATPDAYETTLTVVDPTADRTISLPDATGTIVLTDATQTISNKTLGSNLAAGGYTITGLATPVNASDAVRKDFADAQVAAAATSAASAATSASSAAASATTAANSVATIASYATTASNSAAAAATSATSAAASVTAAATSATSAAASATAAATSATSAAASATAAATSATNASNSASAAATSATSAAASATAAATSATSAAASATTAANSVATIATYATTASNSAAAAATSAASAATSASSAATSAASSALSYTTFNDQYLGAKSSAPTVNNSGGALVNGNLYFNTTDSTLYVRNAGTWQAAAVSTSGFATTGTNTFTGVQTAPSFVPNSSTVATNGMYLPAANTLGLATNSAVRMQINSAGEISVGAAASTGQVFTIDKSLTGAVTTYGVMVEPSVSLDVTTAAYYYGTYARTAAASFTLPTLAHYYAYQAGLGAGSTVTNQYGFWVSNTLTGATNNYGFYGSIASGTGRYNLYMAGTADNYMAGALGIGTTALTATSFRLGKTITGATVAYGLFNAGAVQSDVTSTAIAINSTTTTAASAFTLTNLIQYSATGGTIGTGSTVTNQYGFYVESTLGSNGNGTLTNAYGFYGNLASGTNRWNTYMVGTAANYFAGQTTVGSTSLTLGAGSVAQQFGVVSTSASNIVEVIRGAASQTGNLTEWQNSAGTLLAYVDSSGNIYGNGLLTKRYITDQASTTPYIDFSSNRIRVDARNASYVALTVDGVASQTGDLQQWRNNAGTVLSRINSGGSLELNGKDIELMTLMGAY